jgi:hypothetical protein
MLPNFTNYLLFNDDPKVVLLSSGERVTEGEQRRKRRTNGLHLTPEFKSEEVR